MNYYKTLIFSIHFLTFLRSVSAIPAPSSSTLLASETLRNRGYTLFASSLLSLSNFSGTIFAPPDYSFSFKSFPNNRPSTTLLLYHTLKPPQILKYSQLTSLSQNKQLITLYSTTCLFFSNNFANEPIISSTPIKNTISSVKIRQPDLYVDENVTVHGIDSVLDLTFATKCSDFVEKAVNSNRTFLDHAIRALRRTGYSTFGAAMSVRRNELLGLDSVTVFAVSDHDFFRRNGGFTIDFMKHVVPVRRHLEELVGGVVLETLVTNKSVVVESVGNDVFVAGVKVGRTEVYRNRWVVVVSVSASFDDVSVLFPDNLSEVPSPSPSSVDFGSFSMSPEKSGIASAPATGSGGAGDGRCDMSGVVSVGVEGGDLFCSVKKRRGLREEVVVSSGSSAAEKKVRVLQNVNIADDLFFYL